MDIYFIPTSSSALNGVANGAAGGILIGIAAGVMMLGNGRIAGVSSFFAGLTGQIPPTWKEDLLFLAGLPLGGLIFVLWRGEPHLLIPDSPWVLAGAGFLVGYGARMANGCTSSHTICGLARLSRRSLVATAVFIATAIVTAAGRALL
ncbi:YeeE/YedE family protein [Magnetospirillum molischianum]|uniref:Uncharacterized protein n=1 Tax=Magnetospirillum molischianum DSM 120 TaxID=1150626 RepID=H8FSB7_MAGML|nr:YeeE/YedE thiosulfate transporter family protein [Magnetospirillum molischianum]CCG41255.1 conserved hypothetical protein; putative membrane protein; putative Permeases of the major facilitator superfamily [Magnetospirillum molischianum DSM 120]